MMKDNRLVAITEIIKSYPVETQDGLMEKLKELGFHVTQATVSRDIRELRLSKVTDKSGGIRYALPVASDSENTSKFRTIFREAVISVHAAGTIVVVKCHTGMGSAGGAAIDWMKFEHIVGTIAGDDTIFCACDSTQAAMQVGEQLNVLLLS